MEHLSLRNITYIPEKGKTAIFRDFHMTLDGSEWTVLTGESGTGKTTLGLLLAGGIEADSGTVSVDGVSLGDAEVKPGFLHQNPEYQILGTTVERDIAFGLEHRNVPRNIMRDRVAEMTDLFGIREFQSVSVRNLSGGVKQRTALAALLAVDHPYLILDEPTSYLDYAAQDVLIRTIRKLNDRGIGILWITQYREEGILGDRVLELGENSLLTDSRTDLYINQIHTVSDEEPVVPIPDSEQHPPIVKADHLIFRHRDDTANHPFTLQADRYDLRAGERQGWYGYSGAGKSTFARLLAGIYSPQSGEIELNVPESEVVYVPQFAERMIYSGTLDQNIQLLRGRKGFDGERYRTRLIQELGTMEIPAQEPFRRAIWSFSGGEQRRIVLAVALALNPEVLILDEPTIGISPGDRHYVNRIFTSPKISSIICISHEYNFLRRYCVRGVYFREGQISTPKDWPQLEKAFGYRTGSVVGDEWQERYQNTQVSE